MTPRLPAALVAACLLALALAATAAAHAELVESGPADGEEIETPATLTATFSIGLDADPERSFLIVRNAAGEEVARGRVTDDDPATIAVGLPALPAGEYTVRWQARDPSDNHTERGTFRFTVSGVSVTPSPTPSPAPATEAPATVTPTNAPTDQPTAAPNPSPSPPPVDGEPTGGVTDVLIALVLAGAVIGGLALYLLRRR